MPVDQDATSSDRVTFFASVACFAKHVHVYQRHACDGASSCSLGEPLVSHPLLHRDPRHILPMVTRRATRTPRLVDRLTLSVTLPESSTSAAISSYRPLSMARLSILTSASYGGGVRGTSSQPHLGLNATSHM
jgi:hypothetical protein